MATLSVSIGLPSGSVAVNAVIIGVPMTLPTKLTGSKFKPVGVAEVVVLIGGTTTLLTTGVVVPTTVGPSGTLHIMATSVVTTLSPSHHTVSTPVTDTEVKK